MSGRKRKYRRRYPSGQPVYQKPVDAREIVLNQPHRRVFPDKIRSDQRCVDVLGRLNLYKLISDEELEAARLYARIVLRMAQVLDSPSPNPRSLELGVIPGRTLREMDDDEIQRIRSAYDSAFCALRLCGRLGLRVVNRVVCFGEQMPSGATLNDLHVGLQGLVRHFGLTSYAKQ
jgi:hypothetical protein